jgi:hypothetical protein
LSFAKTIVPVGYFGVVKTICAVKGTVPVEVQEPGAPPACATPCPMTVPFPSKIFIGNVASKNHPPPVTWPIIVTGDEISAFDDGARTCIWPSGEIAGVVEAKVGGVLGGIVGSAGPGKKIRMARRITMTIAKMMAIHFAAFIII